jgi:hypothetical protein
MLNNVRQSKVHCASQLHLTYTCCSYVGYEGKIHTTILSNQIMSVRRFSSRQRNSTPIHHFALNFLLSGICNQTSDTPEERYSVSRRTAPRYTVADSWRHGHVACFMESHGSLPCSKQMLQPSPHTHTHTQW